MGFIAEVHVHHDDLALVPTICSDVDVTFRWEYETTIDGRRSFFVSVFGDDQDLNGALESDYTVDDPTRVATFAKRRLYRVYPLSELRFVPPACVEQGAYVLRIVSDGRGWTVRVHVPDRDTLQAFNRYCVEHDVSFRVEQLYQSETSDDITTLSLTDSQRDLLLTALYAGYYDIPRKATQEDIAAQLGVSTSAISQQIRRAVAQLIESSLDLEHHDRFVHEEIERPLRSDGHGS